MKAAAGANGAIRKAIGTGDNAAASEKAREMPEASDKIALFFKEKGKDDVVKFAEGASAVGKAVAAAATSANDQKAAVAKLGANCQGCHTLYRDGEKFKGM